MSPGLSPLEAQYVTEVLEAPGQLHQAAPGPGRRAGPAPQLPALPRALPGPPVQPPRQVRTIVDRVVSLCEGVSQRACLTYSV